MMIPCILSAKKFHYPFEILIGKADLIVTGHIVEVHDTTYKFCVSKILKGELVSDTLSIIAHKAWLCDPVLLAPTKKQIYCLMLKPSNNCWKILNGSTGELPVVEGKITLKYEYENGRPYRVSLDEFEPVIRHFSECYKFVGIFEKLNQKPRFECICEKIEILNPFAEWLYKQINQHEIIFIKKHL